MRQSWEYNCCCGRFRVFSFRCQFVVEVLLPLLGHDFSAARLRFLVLAAIVPRLGVACSFLLSSSLRPRFRNAFGQRAERPCFLTQRYMKIEFESSAQAGFVKKLDIVFYIGSDLREYTYHLSAFLHLCK